jgi:N-acetylglucosamine-6-phosphate deacetylase
VILSGGRIVAENGPFDGWLRIADADIAQLGPGEPTQPPVPDEEQIELAGRWIVPGFVDIHVHGGGGASYGSGDAADALRSLEFHRGHGTTTTLASVVTAPLDDMVRATAMLADLADDGLLAGVHLEGPFLSSSRRGAQDPAHLLEPDRAALARLLDAGRGHVRVVTFAPELPGALDLLTGILDSGAVAAVGHTDASYREAMQAFDTGARLATHLFNGMRPLHSREGGAIAAALNHPDVVVEIINDGVHIDPAVVALVARLANERLALVTDAMAAAGAGDGVYPLGRMSVRVEHGVAMLADGSSIAGSTLTMDGALRRAVHDVGLTIQDAVAAVSTTPARVLGLENRIGALAVGKVADLVVLDDDLQVVAVMHRGQWLGEQPTSSKRA